MPLDPGDGGHRGMPRGPGLRLAASGTAALSTPATPTRNSGILKSRTRSLRRHWYRWIIVSGMTKS